MAITQIGTVFTSKDQLGKIHHYQLVGLNPLDSDREFILHDLECTNPNAPDYDKYTRVERAWFDHRCIAIN